MCGKKKAYKLNNAGSAIVTVIVVVAFVTILATTVLYTSGMNYYMKMTDLKTKESFYQAETALEAIRAELAEEVSRASGEAYTAVMMQYASLDASGRETAYRELFLEAVERNFAARKDNPATSTYKEVLQAIVNARYSGLGVTAPMVSCSEAGLQREGSPADHAVLKTVQLTFTDTNGYVTELDTDYVILVPKVDFSVDSSAEAWTDGDSSEREKVEFADCVQYNNWVKK